MFRLFPFLTGRQSPCKWNQAAALMIDVHDDSFEDDYFGLLLISTSEHQFGPLHECIFLFIFIIPAHVSGWCPTIFAVEVDIMAIVIPPSPVKPGGTVSAIFVVVSVFCGKTSFHCDRINLLQLKIHKNIIQFWNHINYEIPQALSIVAILRVKECNAAFFVYDREKERDLAQSPYITRK